MSLINCSMALSKRQAGTGALGVCSRSLGVLLLGDSPGGATMAAITSSTTAGLAVRASG